MEPQNSCPELPGFQGRPITIRAEADLRVYRGRLRTSGADGVAVYGASSIRGRLILLERGLVRKPRELERIFVHEVFHFVWRACRINEDARTRI